MSSSNDVQRVSVTIEQLSCVEGALLKARTIGQVADVVLLQLPFQQPPADVRLEFTLDESPYIALINYRGERIEA